MFYLTLVSLSFCCPHGQCRGMVQDSGQCPVCDKQLDLDNVKVELEKLKQRLETVRAALENVENVEENRKNLQELTNIWNR